MISHQNITERKLVEEEAQNQALIDGLTNIPNRRHFDEFFSSEWKRCMRLGMPISLVFIDIDHFKLLNDTYGHQTGDQCLKQFGSLLKKFSKRPSDLCARYGGEEFALILGDTSLEQSKALLNELNDEIRALAIPNEKSPVSPIFTASMGLVTVRPTAKNNEDAVISEADSLLYLAKRNGRNQIVCIQL